MLTRCPACETAFRITAEQLSAAHGRVRCGRCQKVFNALECIGDDALPALLDPALEAGTPAAEVLIVEDSGAQDSGIPSIPAPDNEPQAPPPDGPATEGDSTGVDAVEVVPRDEPTGQDTADDSLDVLLEELPPALREDVMEASPGSGGLGRILWSLAGVLLILLLLSQLAWTFQDRLIAAIPALGGYRDAVCELLDCHVPQAQAPAQAIRMLARDVRQHPRYRDTLLVNGTLVNGSDQPVPFPLLQFGLYNVDGVLIGARRFKPKEYLDQSIDIGQGMLPGQPVHIVLEVTGVTDTAVSFKFDFL